MGFKKIKGFTLIEVMIVVAIIGVLAGIAVPSFLYFNARAKQVEARGNLSAIYSAYLSYQSEFNTYPDQAEFDLGGSTFNCFNITGFEPKGNLRYGYVCNEVMIYAPAVLWPGPQSGPRSDCGGSNSASQSGFTVIACGNIDGDSSADVWYLDDRKVIKNTDLKGNNCNDVYNFIGESGSCSVIAP